MRACVRAGSTKGPVDSHGAGGRTGGRQGARWRGGGREKSDDDTHGGRSRDRTTGRVRVHRGAHTATTLTARSPASDCCVLAIRRPARRSSAARHGAARRGAARHAAGSALRQCEVVPRVPTPRVRTYAASVFAHLSLGTRAADLGDEYSRREAPRPHTSVYQPPRLSPPPRLSRSVLLPRRPRLCASFLIYDRAARSAV